MFSTDKYPSTGFTYTVIAKSDKLPVTVEQVKNNLNYSATNQDALILQKLQAAIKQVERFIGKTIVEKTYAATWGEEGDYTELLYGPIISVDGVVRQTGTISTVFTSDRYYFVGDMLVTEWMYSTSTYGRLSQIQVNYKAGYLRPVTVASNVITLANHGFADGDLVTFTGILTEGTQYTVSNATTNTFEVGETITETDGFVGLLPEDLKEAILMQASKNFLRGEESAGIDKAVKELLRSIQDEISYP